MRRVLLVYDSNKKACEAFQDFCTNIKKYFYEDSYKISARDLTITLMTDEPVHYQFNYITYYKDLCKFMGLAVHEVLFDESSRFDPAIASFLKTKERL